MVLAGNEKGMSGDVVVPVIKFPLIRKKMI